MKDALNRVISDLSRAERNLTTIAEETGDLSCARRAARLALLVEVAVEECAEWLRGLTQEPSDRLPIRVIIPNVESLK